MCRHLLRELAPAAIAQILSDAGCPERMIAGEEANVNDMPGMNEDQISATCPASRRHSPSTSKAVERDLHFEADKPISAYTDEARTHGRIVT